MDIKHKNIVLTGASDGIGKELLIQLSRYEGVKIVAAARHTGNISYTQDKIYPIDVDLSNKEGVDQLFKYAQEVMKDIDIFIADAGFGYLEKRPKPDWNRIEEIYHLNFTSTVYAMEKLIQNSKNRRAAFVSLSSAAGLIPLPYYSLYCSTKSALHFFFETYRYEKPDSIDIITVYPVATRTRFFDKASGREHTPLPKPNQNPKTVAGKIIKGIEKNKKKVYPYPMFRLSYAVSRAFPFLQRWYSRREKERVDKWFS